MYGKTAVVEKREGQTDRLTTDNLNLKKKTIDKRSLNNVMLCLLSTAIMRYARDKVDIAIHEHL